MLSVVEFCAIRLRPRFTLLTAEHDPHDGRRKNEALWPIFQIHHKRSRFIYDMYYRKKRITRELYEFCLREKYADAALIAKWKKVGGTRDFLPHSCFVVTTLFVCLPLPLESFFYGALSIKWHQTD
jgi:hypothetical protein